MKTIAFFNNKGGVGKTTLVYHLSWMLTKLGYKVLAVDLDPQANLTSMFLPENTLEDIWSEEAASQFTIMGALSPIIRGTGDIAPAGLVQLHESLSLLPGELALSQFEGELSEAWGKCLDGKEPAFRTTSAFYRIIQSAGVTSGADVALVDVGPNLGTINRAVLIAADTLVVPLAPDLFSSQGLRNLGPTLGRWRKEWQTRLANNPAKDLALPTGALEPMGYVLLQFGARDNRPVRAYDRWAQKIPDTYQRFVLAEATSNPVPPELDTRCLGMLKHYRISDAAGDGGSKACV